MIVVDGVEYSEAQVNKMVRGFLSIREDLESDEAGEDWNDLVEGIHMTVSGDI